MTIGDNLNITSLKKDLTTNSLINNAIKGFAFSLPISKAGIVGFSILMIILWVFEGNFKNKYKILRDNNFVIVLFALLLLSFISILWAPDKYFALDFIRKYWHFLVIPVIITSLKREYVESVILFFLAGIFISEMFSYAIFFEIIQYKNLPPSNPVPFMDHINYSTYLALAALLLLNKIFFTEQLKYKIFYVVYFLVTVSSLFLIGGRTGQVIFIVTIFIVGAINIRKKLIALTVMLLLSASIVFVAYKVSPNFNSRINQAVTDINKISKGDFTDSFGQRVSLWITGTNIFYENIFTGTGIGNELEGFIYYVNKYNFHHYQRKENEKVGFIDFHNSFIQYSVQFGMVGLILYLTIFYTLFLRKFKDKIYQNLNIIFIVIFLLHSFVFYSFHLLHPMVLFALFASLLSVISRKEEENAF